LDKKLSIDPAVLRRLRQLPKAERIECLLALCELTAGLGSQNSHSQLGIRKLGNKLLNVVEIARSDLSFKTAEQKFSSPFSEITTKSERSSVVANINVSFGLVQHSPAKARSSIRGSRQGRKDRADHFHFGFFCLS
jgi:hypothetical protein